MRARFCCSELKEYKVLDVAVQGIRRCESVKRNERYKEPQICRYYSKNEKVSVFLPILEWSDEDVEDFIMERGIKCAPVYYDKQGRFYVERRLGCMACPLRSDRGKGDFIKHPNLVRAWIRFGKIWWDNHPNANSHKKFRSIYELFVHNVFFDSYDAFELSVGGGMFGDRIDCKQFLEDYFNVKLP